jgi:hypothetical protein
MQQQEFPLGPGRVTFLSSLLALVLSNCSIPTKSMVNIWLSLLLPRINAEVSTKVETVETAFDGMVSINAVQSAAFLFQHGDELTI